jgi:hypothetical protein
MAMIVDDIVEAVWTTSTDWAISIAAMISPEYAEALRVPRDAVAESIKRQIQAAVAPIIVSKVQQKWGVALDANDPFSRSSISGGVGQKIGIHLRDIFDKEILLQDIGAGLAAMINTRYGTTFTTFWPLETLQFEVETQVFALLNQAVDELHAETKAGLDGVQNG